MLRPLSRLVRPRALSALRTYSKPSTPKGMRTNNPAELAAEPFPPNTGAYRESQIKKPLNPAIANQTPTSTAVPSVGAHNRPPELVSSAADAAKAPPSSAPTAPGLGGSFGDTPVELGVGEIAEGKFRVEPLRRVGEDLKTMRARLLYQSRKRGILETDLLLSTFAHNNLEKMDRALLDQYDRFLDENDWDIYYLCTQQAPPTSVEHAEGGSSPPGEKADAGVRGAGAEQASPTSAEEGEAEQKKSDGGVTEFGGTAPTEWAQTVGRNREPYRPPPKRWENSEILKMIRNHVEARKGRKATVDGVGGLGKMPDFK